MIYRNAEMPIINLDHLTDSERKIASGIVATRGKNKGRLRASKPKVERHLAGHKHYELDSGPYESPVYEPDRDQGETAYVWRMVAFAVSPKSQHHCMPCTADFDVPGRWSEKRDRLDELNALADKIISVIPARQHHGTIRWGQAFGQIGTPQVAPDGSIIYR